MNEEQQARLDYFQKHALPWQMEHLKFRAVGLQIFVAIQAGLLVAWSSLRIWPIAVFALAACLSFWLWDSRNRFIINKVHEWGREMADKLVFPTDSSGQPRDGVHVAFGLTLQASGKHVPALAGFKSHTWAVRILLLAAVILWVGLMLFPPPAKSASALHTELVRLGLPEACKMPPPALHHQNRSDDHALPGELD